MQEEGEKEGEHCRVPSATHQHEEKAFGLQGRSRPKDGNMDYLQGPVKTGKHGAHLQGRGLIGMENSRDGFPIPEEQSRAVAF